ncbi:DNA repair protein RadC [Serratia entomophila]|uniref:JAB domain-containing protein n=1 Tax=Serratia entomophila TaxID=42906 RepID=UPI0021772A18|nr:JAB domain-containing protein [Serratia entomophila]CAI1906856.1 DNA repair protein RadC [Serratia entomophila]
MHYESYEQHIITQAIGLLERQLQARTVVLTQPDAVRSYLRLQLERQDREVFMVMYLDNQHRLIACETPFTGTLASVNVYPREIVKQALTYNAAALSLIDVRVLDHIVIGHGEAVSFAERDWLNMTLL